MKKVLYTVLMFVLVLSCMALPANVYDLVSLNLKGEVTVARGIEFRGCDIQFELFDATGNIVAGALNDNRGI